MSVKRPPFPQYMFGETGSGCAQHNDPTCLCDVIVGTPAPCDKTPIFSNMVLDRLNISGVSNGNDLHQWAERLLGAADSHAAYMNGEPKPEFVKHNPYVYTTQAKVGKDTVWGTLPESARRMLVAALTCNRPFDAAWGIVCDRYVLPYDLVRIEGPWGLRDTYDRKRSSYFTRERSNA